MSKDQLEERPQGLFAFLFAEFTRAIQDMRQRVVEEGWFGRVTTPHPRDRSLPHERQSKDRDGEDDPEKSEITFDDLWPEHKASPAVEHAPSRSVEMER